MKGLQEKADAGAVFLVVKHHSICQESKEERAGFKPVRVQNPRTGETITKYIKQYEGVEGLICKIEWYDREHDGTTFKGWKIHLNAKEVPCVLDLPFQSRACKRFMKLAENIDFSQPVEFRAWHDNKTDSTAFYVGQNGESVRQAYTKDEPGDCPPPTKSAVTGKWNFDRQDEYLHEVMTSVVIPAVEEAGNEMPTLSHEYVSPVVAANSHVQDELADEEIPF